MLFGIQHSVSRGNIRKSTLHQWRCTSAENKVAGECPMRRNLAPIICSLYSGDEVPQSGTAYSVVVQEAPCRTFILWTKGNAVAHRTRAENSGDHALSAGLINGCWRLPKAMHHTRHVECSSVHITSSLFVSPSSSFSYQMFYFLFHTVSEMPSVLRFSFSCKKLATIFFQESILGNDYP